MADDWDQYKLLLWKNMLNEYCNKIQFCLHFILPIIICLPLISLEGALPAINENGAQYTPVQLNDLYLLQKSIVLNMTLLYSPKNQLLDDLVKEAANSLNLSGYEGFINARDLERAFQYTNYICGVQFADEWSRLKALPKIFSFNLRFPSELRMHDGLWDTDRLYRAWSGSRCRNKQENTGGPPNYIAEGFLQIQNAISMAYIKLLNVDVKLPEIFLQRYPCPPLIYVGNLHQFQAVLIILLPLFYIYPGTILTRRIALEKEQQLKELFKIIGIDGYVHWLNWFTLGLLLFSIPSIVLIFTLKIPILGAAILPQTNVGVLILYIFIYMLSCIGFTFLIGVLFSKAINATIAYVILHMISPITFSVLLLKEDTANYVTKFFCIVPINAALSAGFYIILSLELFEEGLIWNNLFHETIQLKYLSVGHTMLTLLVTGIICILLSLYIEQVLPGPYGVSNVWYFPLTKKFWLGSKSHAYSSDTTRTRYSAHRQSTAFENEIMGKSAPVKVKNISKIYNKDTLVINNVAFNLYEHEITALMGYEGSGKSTILYIICGLIEPTQGTVTINGFDIRNYFENARKSLAICPQGNALFEDLTVSQHLQFYSELKGLWGAALEAEIVKYLKLFRMHYFRDTRIKKLSNSMKRKVAIACTLCGGAKLILLDMPSLHMDATSRHDLWNVLRKEKKYRTILITTPIMEEIDSVADRIGILDDGELKCFGSPTYLKKSFDKKYKLVCVLTKDSEPVNITEILQNYIPNVEAQSNIGAELSYTINGAYVGVFEQILKHLEDNMDELGIVSMRIQLFTLEDIFIKMDATDQSRKSINISSDFVTINKEVVNGSRLTWNRWFAMFYKRALYLYYRPYILIFMILLSCCPLLIHIIFSNDYNAIQLAPMTYSLNQYKKVITVVERTKEVLRNSYLEYASTNYTKFIMSFGRYYKAIPIGQKSFSEYIEGFDEEEQPIVDREYLAAATIDSSHIVAWFNAQPLHTAPLTLNLIHNALVRALNGPTYEILVTNSPLPYSKQTVHKISQQMGSHFQSIGLFFVWSCYFLVLFPIYERVKHFQLLQMIAGVGVHTFWFANLIFDTLIYTFIFFIMSIILVIFSINEFINYFPYVLLIVFLFELAVIAYIYCVSYLFKTGIYVFMTALVLDWLEVIFENFEGSFSKVKYIFFLLPSLHLKVGLTYLNKNIVNRKFCENPDIAEQADYFKCTFYPQCCNMPNLLGWQRPGILCELVSLCILFIMYFCIIELLDSKVFEYLCTNRTETVYSFWDDFTDSNITQETVMIKQLLTGKQMHDYRLVLDQLTKKYKGDLIVDNVSVTIKPQECLGLMGVNGAGKTTLFKMITGDISITSGQGYACGFNINRQLLKINGRINYCPQIDGHLSEFTCKQTLKIFCLIRGIKRHHIDIIIDQLVMALDFESSLKKHIKDCNNTTKRKLSIAIAIIGLADLILFDEPTTNMDPNDKQLSLNIFSLLKHWGIGILISSHSTEECAAICDRITLMVQGRLICLGTMAHLKAKYSTGLTLKINMKIPPEEKQTLAKWINELTIVLLSKYPSATFESSHENQLKFFIPLSEVKLSELFGFLQNNSETLHIEDFAIDQATLDQVFMEMSADTQRSSRASP